MGQVREHATGFPSRAIREVAPGAGALMLAAASIDAGFVHWRWPWVRSAVAFAALSCTLLPANTLRPLADAFPDMKWMNAARAGAHALARLLIAGCRGPQCQRGQAEDERDRRR